MLLGHAITLAQARSSLAALADSAETTVAASAYEHVLITLDAFHGDDVPALDPWPALGGRDDLFEDACGAIEDLTTHGVDPLHVELILAMLASARDDEES